MTVRDPSWKHDRVTMLPASIVSELHERLFRAHLLREEDLARGSGRDRPLHDRFVEMLAVS